LSKDCEFAPYSPPAYLIQHTEHTTAEGLFVDNGTSNTAKHALFPTAAMNMYAIIVHTIWQQVTSYIQLFSA